MVVRRKYLAGLSATETSLYFIYTPMESDGWLYSIEQRGRVGVCLPKKMTLVAFQGVAWGLPGDQFGLARMKLGR